MDTISVLEKTKTYVIVKIPQKLLRGFNFDSSRGLTEAEALAEGIARRHGGV